MIRFDRISLIVLSFITFSCIEEPEVYDPYAQLEKDKATIKSYLSGHGITNAIDDPYGIQMVITQLGTGLPPQLHHTVDVDYVGKLLSNGTTFDQGNVKGSLSSYIQGWQQAISRLPEGSKATLYIPSPLAYKNQGAGQIPPNSNLVFDVHLKDVIRSSTELTRFGTDTVAIDTYIENNQLQVVNDTTGIRYTITQEGTGAQPTWYSKVKIKLTFKALSDPTKVLLTDSFEPTAQMFSRVVDYPQGIRIGLLRMKEGSKATLYIPSSYGFGTGGYKDETATIPANTNLIVDVELIDIL